MSSDSFLEIVTVNLPFSCLVTAGCPETALVKVISIMVFYSVRSFAISTSVFPCGMVPLPMDLPLLILI